MQPNALLIWQNFIICKKWVLQPRDIRSLSKNLKLDQNLPFWFIPSTHLDLCDHVKFLPCLKWEGGMVEEVFVMDYLSMWLWAKLLQIAEKGGTLGELVKCKPSKIYPTTKNSYRARHVRPPGQTCPAPRLDIASLSAFFLS
jgi:hypothetical protein